MAMPGLTPLRCARGGAVSSSAPAHAGGGGDFGGDEEAADWSGPLDSPVSWEAEFTVDARAAVTDLHGLNGGRGRVGQGMGAHAGGHKQQQPPPAQRAQVGA